MLVIPCERLQEVLVESPRLGVDLAEVIESRRRAVEKVLEGPLRRPGASATLLPVVIEERPSDGTAPGGEAQLVG